MSTEYTEHIDEAMRQLPNPAAVPADNRTPQSPNITLEAWNRLQARLVALETLVAKLGKGGFATAVQEDVSALGDGLGTLDTRVTDTLSQAIAYTNSTVTSERNLRNQAIRDETLRATAVENGKVDKLTNPEAPAVYVGNPDGTQTSKYLDSAASGNSVPLRDSDGNLNVGDATQAGHAVNLGTARGLIQEQIGRVYKPAGSVSFAELVNTVDLDETNLGNIYNIRNAFTTTSDFMEGAGVNYPAGTNVAVVKDGTNYYFDVFVGQVDLSNYYTKQEVDAGIGQANAYTDDAINGVPVKSGQGKGTVVSFDAVESTSGVNVAGSKAWFWLAFNTSTNTLYLTATQPRYSQVLVGQNVSYQESGDWGVSVGDELSIVNDIRVDFAVVTSVDGNAIGLDRTIFTEAKEDTRDFRYIVVNYNNPYAGVYDYSSGATALGSTTKALQVGAMSFGQGTVAAGAYSVAGGRGSKAGFLGVAIGNAAEAKGTYSTAFGSETRADGSCAFAAGSGAVASGPYSISIGRFTKAHRQASQAFGSEAEAWADFSTVFGYKTSATNKSQFVVGRYNKETDTSHGNTDTVLELFVVGNGSSAARSNAFVITNLGSAILHDSVIGQNVYAALIAGSGNTVNGSNSIIAGRQGTVNSADCILVGRTNDDGVTAEINANNSAAFGMGVKVLSGHRSSTVTGFGTKSSNPYCLVGGLYNAGISNNLFEIGNGNKTTGSNAFAVSRAGTARLGANPVHAMDATTKQYVDTSLAGYVKKTDYASAYNAGVVKVPSADDSGLRVMNGNLEILGATHQEFVGVPSQVKLGTNGSRPITPKSQHTSVFFGLSKAAGVDLSSTTAGETPPDAGNAGVYPEAAKTAIKNMLGVTDGVKLYQHKFSYEMGDEEYGDIYILSSDATPYATLSAVPDAGLWNAWSDVLYNSTLYLAYQVKLKHLSGGRTRCQWFITDNTVGSGTQKGILDLTINDSDLDYVRDTVTEL